MLMNPIKTPEDYQNALNRGELLMRSSLNTPEGDELDILVTRLEAYERKHYPVDFLDHSK